MIFLQSMQDELKHFNEENLHSPKLVKAPITECYKMILQFNKRLYL